MEWGFFFFFFHMCLAEIGFLIFLYVMSGFIQCIILSYLERKHTHRGSFFDLKIGNCSASHAVCLVWCAIVRHWVFFWDSGRCTRRYEV